VIVLVVVRMPSPIDWHYYTAYKPAVNPTLHNSRRFIVMAYPNLALEHEPTKFVLLGPIVEDVS
jgi:hypothetical protein